MNTPKNPITVSEVPEGDLGFMLTQLREDLIIRSESLICIWMRRLCKHYSGALWHYYRLSNGGFYMAPDLDELLEVQVDGNGFNGKMSADAAGIVATLFGLNHLVTEVAERDAVEVLIKRHELLYEFAIGHPEATAIFDAID
ncbi:antirestriction protein (plasmid) [Xylella fastidiosa]|uniref:antirestriction protein n=2 Tax=Xylella fastidiosa TaxID=2371 RepID=UPI000765E70F|nr:antirestriction protein [Xylella fastidiosa]KXB19789.1 antirestriction protein [Xylella fastidiosa]